VGQWIGAPAAGPSEEECRVMETRSWKRLPEEIAATGSGDFSVASAYIEWLQFSLELNNGGITNSATNPNNARLMVLYSLISLNIYLRKLLIVTWVFLNQYDIYL
jgi:hypothetical protein